MKFFVQFVGHINERKRPEGFPKIIIDSDMVEVNSSVDLIQWINVRSNSYLAKQAMSVSLHPSNIKEQGQIQTDRVIVPMHMITHISFSFNQVIEQEVVTDGLGGQSQTPEPEDTPKDKQN